MSWRRRGHPRDWQPGAPRPSDRRRRLALLLATGAAMAGLIVPAAASTDRLTGASRSRHGTTASRREHRGTGVSSAGKRHSRGAAGVHRIGRRSTRDIRAGHHHRPLMERSQDRRFRWPRGVPRPLEHHGRSVHNHPHLARRAHRRDLAVRSLATTAGAASGGGVGTLGDNEYNQLGGPVLNGRPQPPKSAALYKTALAPAGATQLRRGTYFTLALYPDGTVWGWGGSTSGAEGIGHDPNGYADRAPQKANISDVKQIATGLDHSLFLTSSGDVYGAGSGSYGDLGQPFGPFFDPVAVPGISGVTAVSAEGQTSFALKGDGTVYSWGANSGGDLGLGTCDGADHRTPMQIPGLSGVVAVGAKLALASDGTVWWWGGGSCQTPAKVPGLSGVAALGDGDAVVKSDGTVWTVGSGGAARQVGGLSGITPSRVASPKGWPLQPTAPSSVGGTTAKVSLVTAPMPMPALP